MKTATRTRKNAQILAGSIAALLAAHSARAAVVPWTPNADGDWTNILNWNAGVGPVPTTTDTAQFNTALTLFGKHIFVDANRTIGTISFGNASQWGYTLNGGNLKLDNGGLITQAAGGTHMDTITGPIEVQGDGGTATFTSVTGGILNIAGAVTGVSTIGNTTTLTLNGAGTGGSEISAAIGDGAAGGKVAVTKAAAGNWYLSGNNNYTGTTTISLGVLVAESATALGNGGDINFGGGTLQYQGQSAGTDWASRFKSTAAINLVTNYQDVTLAGAIDATNTFGLSKTGTGTLTLSGANLYTGVTTIGQQGGALLAQAGGGSSFTALSSVLKLSSAGALGGGGNITFASGTLEIANGVDYSARIVGSAANTMNLIISGSDVTFASPLAATNTGGLTKLGTKSLTLAGVANNLYTGTTTISGGALIIDNTTDNATDRLSSGALQINSGSLIFNGNGAANSTESVGQINVGGGAATLTVNPGTGMNATLSSTGVTLTGSMVHGLTNGTMLVNGNKLGVDDITSATTDVARIMFTAAPALAGFVGTSNPVNTGAGFVKDLKIVPFLLGESAAGLGTTTGVANTFVTYQGVGLASGTGLRPLDTVNEFQVNTITAAQNTRLTGNTTAASTVAVNSLVMAGGDLTINDSNAGALVTLTNTSGAILFTATSAIKPSGTAGTLAFAATEAQITVNSGVTGTISARLSGTGASGLTKSGAGTLNLTGVNVVNGSFSMEGGGIVNVQQFFNSTTGSAVVGTSSAGNTLNVTGLGALRTSAGGGTSLLIGDGVYGNNTVNVSSPGSNRTSPSLYAGSVLIGRTSANNSMTVSNGAYVSNNGIASNILFRVGQNPGSNNNSLTVTGAFSVFDKQSGGGGAIQVGDGSNNNVVNISAGGVVLPRRWNVSQGGANNSVVVDGNRSMSFVNDGNNASFAVGGGAGAYGNSFKVQNGAVALYGGTSAGRGYSVGDAIGADNNSFVVDGLGSLARGVTGGSHTFNIGGNGNSTMRDGGTGNHLDVINGGTLAHSDTAVFLAGTNTAFNLGNGVAVSTATVASNSGVGISGVYLKNASDQLIMNSGRLIAVSAGNGTNELVAGAGEVVLAGPAYFRNVTGTATTARISTLVSGAGDLIKEGTGTLILSGTRANTYSGTTKVTAGTLALDYTATGNNAISGRLPDASVLVLGGGTLDLRNGGSAHTEVVASTALNAGRSGVTRTSGASVLSMGNITPGVGIVNFGADSIATTSNANDATGILGSWATVAGTDWAANDGGGNVVAWTGTYTQDAIGAIVAGAADNVKMTNGLGIYFLPAASTINTLLNTDAVGGGSAFDLGANNFATNGIVSAVGATSLFITTTGGTLSAATAGANLAINANSAITIDPAIVANGSSGLATAGAVTLNGVNTYTGPTGVGGTLTIDGAGQLNSGSYSGAISIAAGGTLVMNSSVGNVLSGVISGDGVITQSGAGSTTLSGANTYTGLTTVSNGTLIVGHAQAFGPAFTAAISQSGGLIQLNNFSIALNSFNGIGGIIENGGAADRVLTVNRYTTDANFSNSIANYDSYTGILQDGSGGGKLGLTVNGSNGLVLRGVNTYSGDTTINGATIVVGDASAFGGSIVTLNSASVIKQLATAVGSIANAFVLGGNVLFDLRGSDTLGTNLNDMTLTGPISGSGRILAVGDAAGKTLTLSGAKPSFSGGLIQSGQSNNYNTPGGSAVTTRFMNIAIDDVLSLGTGQFYARIDTGVAATAGFGTLKTNADLSAGSGVTNPIDIGQSARLVVEASGANHLKLSGAITGAGNLFKIGTATLTLSGLNSYTGNTTISEGTLSVGADANLGASPSVVFNGGTLQVTGTALTSLGIHTPSFVATKVARFEIVSAANTFTVSQSVASTSGGLIKTGAGTLSLTASNSGSYTGVTNVAAGVLLLNNANAVPGGIATLGGTSRIEFNGGVIGLGVGDFTRNLGNTTTDATFVGAGGWAAYTADRTVDLGGAAGTIDWDAANTGFNSQTLILGAATADKTVTLLNPLTWSVGGQKTLQVDNGSAANDAIVSAAITSPGFADGITKTGDGSVQLNGLQAYDVLNATAGTTNVNGVLGVFPGTGSVAVTGAGTKVKFGTVSQTLGSLTIGAGSTVAFTSGTATGAFTGGGGGGGKGFGGGAIVPEPGTLGLLLIGSLGMLSRRRRKG